VKYWDGQFDDARLALALARTAAARGALVVNHCEVKGLIHECRQSGGRDLRGRRNAAEALNLRARCVVNATGVWVDDLAPDGRRRRRPAVKAHGGAQPGRALVVDREFLPGDHALLVPKTADGRVLFAVPWLGKLILGTTDTPRHDVVREPEPFKDEVAFILGESARYLARAPQRSDVRSMLGGPASAWSNPAGEEATTPRPRAANTRCW
jgi:glycerol-3-phosphate dehydrogenase